MALKFLGCKLSLLLACMDAIAMGFRDGVFDLTISIQNGICAFAVHSQHLFREALL